MYLSSHSQTTSRTFVPHAAWTALKDLIGNEATGQFNYVGTELSSDDNEELTVHAFKHERFGRYIRVDNAGCCYLLGFMGNRTVYMAVDPTVALEPLALSPAKRHRGLAALWSRLRSLI